MIQGFLDGQKIDYFAHMGERPHLLGTPATAPVTPRPHLPACNESAEELKDLQNSHFAGLVDYKGPLPIHGRLTSEETVTFDEAVKLGRAHVHAASVGGLLAMADSSEAEKAATLDAAKIARVNYNAGTVGGPLAMADSSPATKAASRAAAKIAGRNYHAAAVGGPVATVDSSLTTLHESRRTATFNGLMPAAKQAGIAEVRMSATPDELTEFFMNASSAARENAPRRGVQPTEAPPLAGGSKGSRTDLGQQDVSDSAKWRVDKEDSEAVAQLKRDFEPRFWREVRLAAADHGVTHLSVNQNIYAKWKSGCNMAFADGYKWHDGWLLASNHTLGARQEEIPEWLPALVEKVRHGGQAAV